MNNPELYLKSLHYIPGVNYNYGQYVGFFENSYLMFILSFKKVTNIHTTTVNNDLNFEYFPSKKELEFIHDQLIRNNKLTSYKYSIYVKDEPDRIIDSSGYRVLVNRIYE